MKRTSRALKSIAEAAVQDEAPTERCKSRNVSLETHPTRWCGLGEPCPSYADAVGVTAQLGVQRSISAILYGSIWVSPLGHDEEHDKTLGAWAIPPDAHVDDVAFQATVDNSMQFEFRDPVVVWIEFLLGESWFPKHWSHRISSWLP
jgi:hypothetical protein